MRIIRIDSKFYQRILSSPRREKNPLSQLYIDSRRKRGVIFQSIAVIFQNKCRRDFRGKKNYKNRYRYYHPLDCLIASLFSFSSAIFFIIRSIGDRLNSTMRESKGREFLKENTKRRRHIFYFFLFVSVWIKAPPILSTRMSSRC